MDRVKTIVWGSRRRRIAAVVSAFLLTASTAAAATFLLYSGVNGSGQGTFATSSTVGALTINLVSQPVLGPGDVSAPLDIWVVNNDPAAPHAFTTAAQLTETFTSVPSQCAAHLSLQNESSILATAGNVPAGQNKQLVGNTATITLAAAAPASCANGTWSISWTGLST